MESYEWMSRLDSLTKEMNIRYDKLAKEHSEIDKQREDLLHYIEFGRYDAVEGWALLSKLKEVQCKRRVIKDELAALQTFRDVGLKNSVVSKHIKTLNKQKGYKLRTKVLDGVKLKRRVEL